MVDISRLIRQVRIDQERNRGFNPGKRDAYAYHDSIEEPEDVREKGEKVGEEEREDPSPDEVNVYLLERIINDDYDGHGGLRESSGQAITDATFSLKKIVKKIKHTQRELGRYRLIKQSMPMERMYNAGRRIFQVAGIRIRDLQPLEDIFSAQIANVREMNQNLATMLLDSRYVIRNFEERLKSVIRESASNYEIKMLAGTHIPEYEKNKAELIATLNRIQKTDRHYKANLKYQEIMTELIELENRLAMEKINVDVTGDSDENLEKSFNHMMYLNAIGHCAYRLGVRIANNHKDYYNTLRNCKEMYFMSRNIAKAIDVISPHIAKLDEYISNIESDVIAGLTDMNAILTRQRSPAFLLTAGHLSQDAIPYSHAEGEH